MSGQLLVRPAPTPRGDAPAPAASGCTCAGPDGAVALDFVDQRTFGHLSRRGPRARRPTARPAGRGSDLAAVPGAGRAHRPGPARPRTSTAPALVAARAASADRDQARAARPDPRVGRRQHLRRRGAVARAAARRAAPTATLRRGRGRARARRARARSCARRSRRAGRASTRCTSTSTARPATSTGRWRCTGRPGRPCPRCGALVVREAFMNRSSFRCPQCQPRPRAGRRSSSGRAGVSRMRGVAANVPPPRPTAPPRSP